jgi:cytochrome P450
VLGESLRLCPPAWALWPDPTAFRPERFGDGAGEHHRFAWFPFGGGARVCVGKELAMTEAVVVLALLFRRFDWAFSSPFPAPEPVIVLRPGALAIRPQAV